MTRKFLHSGDFLGREVNDSVLWIQIGTVFQANRHGLFVVEVLFDGIDKDEEQGQLHQVFFTVFEHADFSLLIGVKPIELAQKKTP